QQKWQADDVKINWSGEGNNTTSHKTSNKGTLASSKIDSIHISIHIYHSLGNYTSPVIRDQAGG
ncbi:TPA: hypothetical protein ACS6CP_004790, partial [Escherichia coli]